MKLDRATAATLRDTHGILFYPRVKEATPVKSPDAPFERFSQHQPGNFMPLGAYSYSNSYFSHVSRIGRYCSIGLNVEVMNNKHPADWVSANPVFYRARRAEQWNSKREDFPPFEDTGPPVEIRHDVWIGDGVLMAHGVKLGTGCVIAARSIVTRDVPPYAVVGGAPARLIRWRFDKQIMRDLLISRWWEWPVSVWDGTDPRDIQAFLKRASIVRDSEPRLQEDRMTARDLLTKKGDSLKR